jgi:Fe2+ transport system protein FeoA
MKLSDISKGTSARISALPGGDIRSQFIRIGLMEGSIVQCLERLPGGTLVLRHSRQEVALSTELAASILVSID